MKTLHLVQGTPEWHAHRASHHNASEAAVMLGLHPSVTRGELLKVRATGIERDISDFLQRIFDDGHHFEALARPLAEKIVGEDLFPCVGVADTGPLSASFDGLTLLLDIAWEHKMLNATLREAMFDGCSGTDLPIYHQVQMEQQCMVSGAELVLFMASEWDGDTLIEERHCWYRPSAELRARIVTGWTQFEADLDAYTPAPAEAIVIGRTPETLPALRVEVTGMVKASNLAEFRAHAFEVLNSINRDLRTDEDFANAEQTVKWCSDVESRLAATKEQVLGQTADIEAVFRTMDDVAAETRRIRLELDRLVSREKEARRGEIVAAGVTAVREHYATINATLGEHALKVSPGLPAEIGAAIKGKRSLTSMRDAVDAATANAKIAASQEADRVRANVAILAEHADHASLFADRVQLCATKTAEDLRNLITARIAEHQRREAERQERERPQALDAQEHQARADETEQQALAVGGGKSVSTGELRAAGEPGICVAKPPASSARIKLGEINAWIAPLSISADGLATLGFRPVSTSGAAKLYAATDFPRMCAALARVLASAAQQDAA